MPFGAAALLLWQAAAPRSSPAAAAADAVVEQSLALGIDFEMSGLGRSRAAREDMEALAKAAPGEWLDAQIQVADDSIAEPPKALRDFLSSRREPLWAIVATLEKGPPEWQATSADVLVPRLMPWIRLHKILLATALSEERERRVADARRALEASWSLGRAFPGPNVLIARILGVAVERWQGGVLRKLRQPPLAWIDRLADDEPWRKLAEAIAAEGRISDPSNLSPATDTMRATLWAKAMANLAEALPKIPPCDRDALSDANLWRHAAAAFQFEGSDEARAWEASCKEIIQGNVASMIRRTARLRVDRELTLKILQLRLERAAAPDRKWPERADPGSRVCPGSTYRYGVEGDRVEIRFQGSVDTPEGGVVLPLGYAALDSPPDGAR
jgi:hypothetical protein